MNVNLLNKATSSDASPTPGYLFEEIAKMTLSNYEVNLKIVAFLGLRLNNRNPNVKWKVLLVIRHVSIKGSPQFKMNMMREHLGGIKQCLSWTGPVDPIRGDEANQRIRDAAAHAIDALSSDSSAQLGASRMVGMGSNSMDQQPQQQPSSSQQHQGSSYVGGGGGRMEGIGSEPWDPNKKSSSTLSSAFTAARSVASKVVYAKGTPEQVAMAQGKDLSHSYASNRGSNPHSNGGQWKPTPGFTSGGGVNNNGAGGNGATYNSNNGNNVAISWNEGQRGGRGVGGVWGTGGGGSSTSNNHVPTNNQTSSQSSANHSSSGHTGGGNADGTYERTLIGDLCAPGGTKAVPPPDELNKFIQLAPSLSPELVGPNLLEQFLLDGTWQSKNKALTVATSLVQGEGCRAHADWLAANALDDLAVLSESCPKPQVCAKAKSLLSLLRGEESQVQQTTTMSRTAQPPVYETQPPQMMTSSQFVESEPIVGGEVDLLGGFGENESPNPPAPPQSAPQQAPPLEQQIMMVPSSPVMAAQASPQQQAQPNSLFGNLTVKNTPPVSPMPPVQTTTQSQGQSNMFGGLNVSNGPLPPTPPQSQVNSQPVVVQQTPPPAAPEVHDPFGMADLSSTVPQQVPPPSGQQGSGQEQMNLLTQMSPPMQSQMNSQQMQGQMMMNQQAQMMQPMNHMQSQMNSQQMQGQMMMNQPMNQMPGYNNQMNNQYLANQMNSMNMGGGQMMMMNPHQRTMVPMNQAMMSSRNSASIPDAETMQSMGEGTKAGSGFGFMGSVGRSRVASDPKDDAFSFVLDSMKAK